MHCIIALLRRTSPSAGPLLFHPAAALLRHGERRTAASAYCAEPLLLLRGECRSAAWMASICRSQKRPTSISCQVGGEMQAATEAAEVARGLQTAAWAAAVGAYLLIDGRTASPPRAAAVGAYLLVDGRTASPPHLPPPPQANQHHSLMCREPHHAHGAVLGLGGLVPDVHHRLAG